MQFYILTLKTNVNKSANFHYNLWSMSMNLAHTSGTTTPAGTATQLYRLTDYKLRSICLLCLTGVQTGRHKYSHCGWYHVCPSPWLWDDRSWVVDPLAVLVSDGSVTLRTPVRNKQTLKLTCLLTPEHLGRGQTIQEPYHTSTTIGRTCVCSFSILATPCEVFECQQADSPWFQLASYRAWGVCEVTEWVDTSSTNGQQPL